MILIGIMSTWIFEVLQNPDIAGIWFAEIPESRFFCKIMSLGPKIMLTP